MRAPGDELAAEAARLGTAALLDAAVGGRWIRSLRPVVPGASVAGPAWCGLGPRGDNFVAHLGVAEAQPGCVLVIDVGSDRTCAYWGEVLTSAAQARGIAGLVISGMVRDIASIRESGFPVFARGVSPVGPDRRSAGSTAATVRLAGTTVTAGDWIVGDDDGAVVLPAASIVEAIRRAQAKETREAVLIKRLAGGTSQSEG